LFFLKGGAEAFEDFLREISALLDDSRAARADAVDDWGARRVAFA